MACTAYTAAAILARKRWNLGDRKADDLFHEIFWTLLTVSIALVPAALKGSLAPTLLSGLAVPLLVARARVSAHQADEDRGHEHHKAVEHEREDEHASLTPQVESGE